MSGALLMMLGAGGPPGVVALPSSIDTGNVAAPTDLTVKSDGNIAYPAGSNAATWVSPQISGIGDHYQVIFRDVTGDTGSLSGAALDTWLDLSSNRTWTLALGNLFVSGTLAIREKVTQIERDSCSVTITNGTA